MEDPQAVEGELRMGGRQQGVVVDGQGPPQEVEEDQAAIRARVRNGGVFRGHLRITGIPNSKGIMQRNNNLRVFSLLIVPSAYKRARASELTYWLFWQGQVPLLMNLRFILCDAGAFEYATPTGLCRDS